MRQQIPYNFDPSTFLANILRKPLPDHIKIKLIESLKFKLMQFQELEQKGSKINLSKESGSRRRISLQDRRIQEENKLIERILSKQRKKIEMEEEIETAADDLFELDKVIKTKNKFYEELMNQIEIKKC